MSDEQGRRRPESEPEGPEATRRSLEIVGHALDLSPGERAEFVEGACGGDVILRREVEMLLAADAPSGFLEVSAGELAANELAAETHTAGALLGPYRLLRKIGEGGASRVWLAERNDGLFEQQVAIKVLRRFAGDPEESRRRFEIERRILARLEHPHIARILDGGISDGRPYVVLEYIDGLPITEHCWRRRLDLDARLRLFLDACDAVAHAHRHLVVHRDLKPSNMLVTSEGQVRLLDFGIAKLLAAADAPALVEAPKTRTGLLLLTPEYAAPEQLRGKSVSTATDVYGLGLLLYELLTDRRPFDLDGKRPSEIERIVCDELPYRPSIALHPPRDRATPIVRAALRGDLDTIVLKALRKEPDERYGSAQELRDDVDRHLSALPVLARPITTGYRLSKFVSRHRGPVAAGLLMALFLVSSLIAVTLEQRQTVRERNRAEIEAQKARRVTDFTLTMLESANPESGIDDLTVREMLLAGVKKLELLEEEPLAQAEVIEVIIQALKRLGSLNEAAPLVDRLIELRREHNGPDSQDLATALVAKAGLLTFQGRPRESEPLLLEAVAIDDRAYPGEDREPTVWHLRELTRHYLRTGQFALAEESLERGLTMARRLELHAQADMFLGAKLVALESAGDYETARPMREELLRRTRATLGAKHPDVAAHHNNIAWLDLQLGDYESALEHYRESLAIDTEVLPEGHFQLGTRMTAIGNIYVRMERHEEAEHTLREAFRLVQTALGDNTRHLVPPTMALAQLRLSQGRYAEAEERLIEARERIESSDAKGRPYGLWQAFGSLYAATGRLVEAEDAYRRQLESTEERFPEHPQVVDQLLSLAELRRRRDDPAGARKLLERAVSLAEKLFEPDHPRRREAEAQLAALGD